MTAPLLAQAGRALIREGEVLYLIEMRRGEPCLTPAAAEWSRGDHDPQRCGYWLTLNGPSSSIVVHAPAEQVVHLKWAETPGQPWRGMSPLHLASQTARRAWAVESRPADLAALNVSQRGIVNLKGAGDAVVDAFADARDDGAFDSSVSAWVTNADSLDVETLTSEA
ncbi:MAG: hypothetical protein OXM54_14505 [Acidimicrobiaceae bacterium]|nr:hypothetical protein [Acidimicrobiaceae bacterium]